MRLDEAECRRRFGDARVARLATIRAGAPRLVPLVFALDGETVYSAVDRKPKSTRDLRRLTDIAAVPEVSLLADHYDDDWARLWWVRADGRARVVEHPEAALAALARKYPQYSEDPPPGPVLAVDVQGWRGWAATPG